MIAILGWTDGFGNDTYVWGNDMLKKNCVGLNLILERLTLIGMMPMNLEMRNTNQKEEKRKEIKAMLIVIFLLIVFILFVVCVIVITLSDTETFKAIDRKIANKINGKEKRK